VSSTCWLAHWSLWPTDYQTRCQSQVRTQVGDRQRQCIQCREFGVRMEKGLGFCDVLVDFQTGGNFQYWLDIYIQVCELNVMVHRCEHLCSASQLWLPHLALCVVPPECFWDLHIWSRAMGSKSGKLQYIADHDSAPLLGSRPHKTLGWTSLDFLIYRQRLS